MIGQRTLFIFSPSLKPATHLTSKQRRALAIADNQLPLNAGWDEEVLRLELAALQEQDFDLQLIGFDDAELERLLAEQVASEELADADARAGFLLRSGTGIG